MNRTISVVIPSFNQGKYIKQAIESVLSQEGDFYIELIVSDGGSTDETSSILKEYKELIEQKKYPSKCNGITFKYWSEKDRGISDAMNKGYKISSGEILGWIGTDDFYLPNAFKKVFELFDKNKDIDFVYGKTKYVYENCKPPKDPIPDPKENETFETLRTRGNSFATPATFFTKKILDQVGYLDESLQCCLDLDLWMRIFKAGKAKYLPEYLAAFRIWENSKTFNLQKKFREEKEIISKKYGGNIIPAGTIYKIRGKMPALNRLRDISPRTYETLKKIFYKIIDIFKYRQR